MARRPAPGDAWLSRAVQVGSERQCKAHPAYPGGLVRRHFCPGELCTWNSLRWVRVISLRQRRHQHDIVTIIPARPAAEPLAHLWCGIATARSLRPVLGETHSVLGPRSKGRRGPLPLRCSTSPTPVLATSQLFLPLPTSAHGDLSIGITVCFVTAIHNRRRQLAAAQLDQHRASQSVRAGSLQGLSQSGTWMILAVVGWRGEIRYLQLSSESATMLRASPSGLERGKDWPSMLRGESSFVSFSFFCRIPRLRICDVAAWLIAWVAMAAFSPFDDPAVLSSSGVFRCYPSTQG